MKKKIGFTVIGAGIWFGSLTAVAYPELRAPCSLIVGSCTLALVVALGVRVIPGRDSDK